MVILFGFEDNVEAGGTLAQDGTVVDEAQQVGVVVFGDQVEEGQFVGGISAGFFGPKAVLRVLVVVPVVELCA